MADQPDGKSVTVQLGGDDVLIWVGVNAASRLDPLTLELVRAAHEALQAGLSPEELETAIERILVEPSEVSVDDICLRVLGGRPEEAETS